MALLIKGVLDIDDNIFNEYLNCFTDDSIYLNLDDWLYQEKIENNNSNIKLK